MGRQGHPGAEQAGGVDSGAEGGGGFVGGRLAVDGKLALAGKGEGEVGRRVAEQDADPTGGAEAVEGVAGVGFCGVGHRVAGACGENGPGCDDCYPR